ncbi:MAG: hypothetical protein JRN44_00460 [Nitrososphaerota archaeon]|jgi:hypothetical protein|nr:hypothetical protein [Nitrososphaerota archaeon]MDG6941848.1 hypothetical protein [Nitrososphaerota archaeon]MDG6946979.1 hypothetical protein [Nitrososphaerota archaeon]MDG6950609.1 hypothetical protein [Nitrososphaerota archaeon]
MAGTWEIRGLFGNEYAMEQAIEELKKQGGLELVVIDRRNVSVRLARRDRGSEDMVKRTFEIHHGFTEHEGPLGEFDRQRREEREKKERKEEEKRRRAKG